MPRILVAVLIALSLTLSACAGGAPLSSGAPSESSATASPPPSPAEPSTSAPSATASAPAASPTARATRSPAASSDPIGVDSIARVVTSDLRMRSKPGVSDDSKLLEPLLQSGRDVFVMAGPVPASGYDWYQVTPLPQVGRIEDWKLGWVAASKDGEPWLAGGGFHCPAPPDEPGPLLAIQPLVGLACFGDQDLMLAARLVRPEATCGVEIGWTIVPEWLGSTCMHPTFLLANLEGTDVVVDAIIEPGLDISDLEPGPEPEFWLDVEVTGRFDHPAARTCRGVAQDTPVPITAEAVVLACRTQFVITAIEKTGYLP